ncbi:MAG: hypothetical protein WCT25_03640 [Candidatus Paceibacterota bacterium]|jgi:hypothetical protein
MKTNKMLEAGNQTIKARRGVVKFVSRTKGYGFVTGVEGVGGQDVWFPIDDIGNIIAGDNHPRILRDNRVQLFPGTVVMILAPFDGRGSLATDGVGRLMDYVDAEREIAKRPYFRVMHLDTRFNGQKMTAGAREVQYAEGTLAQLEREFPIGTPNDPLAKGYKTAVVTVPAVRWDRRQADGSWKVQSTDPRRWAQAPEPKVPAVMLQPIAKPTGTPAPLMVRVLKVGAGGGTQVWAGPIVELSKSTEFTGAGYTVEKVDGTVNGEVAWTEIADPRAKVAPSVPTPARQKAAKPAQPVKGSGQTAPTGVSVAPAKKAKSVQTVKGLDALSIAPAPAGK